MPLFQKKRGVVRAEDAKRCHINAHKTIDSANHMSQPPVPVGQRGHTTVAIADSYYQCSD